ncbi:MAG: DUF86 domain-containing protein [Candidatus Methanoplasma sp.]|jgi:uncharacterized protein with HEPN domain|nr:DUF86 domain-containing protein [Candidatus Methanoplasma sp.]
MRDDRILLERVIEYCEDIKSDVDRFGNDQDDFVGDESYQRSCCMSLMQIGETVNRLSDELIASHKDVEWISIIGFRNIVAHRYETVTPDRLWDIIIEDVPKLKSDCKRILADKKDITV